MRILTILTMLLLSVESVLGQAGRPPVTTLSGMSDVSVSGQTNGQPLIWNTTLTPPKWNNNSTLTDIQMTSSTAGAGSSTMPVANFNTPALLNAGGTVVKWGNGWNLQVPITDNGSKSSIDTLNRILYQNDGASAAINWSTGLQFPQLANTRSNAFLTTDPTGKVSLATVAGAGSIPSLTDILAGDGAGNAISSGFTVYGGGYKLSSTVAGAPVTFGIQNLSNTGRTIFDIGNDTSLTALQLGTIGSATPTGGPFTIATPGDTWLQNTLVTGRLLLMANGVIVFSNTGGATQSAQIGNGLSVGSTTDPGTGIINAGIGFRINNTGPLNTIPLGNGTQYIPSTYTIAPPGTNGNILTASSGNWISAAPTGVQNSGTPTANQLPIWVDATHIKGVTALTGGTVGQALIKNSSTDYDWNWATVAGGGGGGTVTSFSAGNFSPLFTTSVATATTTPALTFTASSAAANQWFGNDTASSAASTFNAIGALTATNDTNVTLTLGGSPGTALLNPASLTLGWTGTLAIARGGTGAATTGSNTFFGNNTSTTGSAPAFTTMGDMTAVNDTNVTLTLGGTPLASLTKSVSLTLGWTGVLPVTRGGTGAATVPANSYFGNASGVTAAPTFNQPNFTNLAGTAATTQGGAPTGGTVGQVLTKNSSTNYDYAWTSPAGTGTVTSFSAGALSPLFTTSVATATTTPALSFTLSTAAANTYFGNNTASTAAPSFVADGALTATNDTNVTLTLGGTPATALLKATSLTLGWTGTLAVSRGGTGTTTSTGTGNTVLSVSPTFTGTVTAATINPTNITGTTTNDSASAGSVGEFASSAIASTAAVALTNSTAANVTSISLTAGDWDVEGMVSIAGTSATISARLAAISTASATIPDNGYQAYDYTITTTSNADQTMTLSRQRISLAATTTVYLCAETVFTAGTVKAFGNITARRMR